MWVAAWIACGYRARRRAAERQVGIGLGGRHLDEVLQDLAGLVAADAQPARAPVPLAAREGGRALERGPPLAQLLVAALRRDAVGGGQRPARLRLRAPPPPPLHQRPANKAEGDGDRPGRRADGCNPHGRTACRSIVHGWVVRRGRRGRRRRVLDTAALARAAEVLQLSARHRAELKPLPTRPTAAVVAALLGPRRWDGRKARWRRWRGWWKRRRWRRRRRRWQRRWVVQAAA